MDPAEFLARNRVVKKGEGVSVGAGEASGAQPLLGDDFLTRNRRRRVQRTMDGDTLEATGRSKLALPYRFAGIDAPESAQGQLGADAQRDLDEMIEEDGGEVRLGSQGSDGKGRTVSVLYTPKGRNLNVELVRRGRAKVYERYLSELPKPVQQALKDAQQEAQNAGRGLWAEGMDSEDPEEFRRSQEAIYGSRAAGMGHTRGERRDEGKVYSPGEFLKRNRNPGADPEYFLGRSSYPRPEREDGPPIKGVERYPVEEGFLDRVLGGLDYLGNVNRSALKGTVEGGLGRGLAYGGQAAAKRRKTTAGNLKDTVTGELGLGKLRAGDDDGTFQGGDLVDFAADLLIDVVTDPVTWLTAGAGRLAKGGTQLAVGAREVKLAEAGEGVLGSAGKTYLKAKTTAQGVLGGAYGYGSAEQDAETPEKIFDAALGAALGVAAGPAMAKTGKLARGHFNDVTNWYARKTRGSAFGDLANQRTLAIEAFEKKKNIAEWIRQGRLGALQDLDEVERLQVGSLMQQLKTKTIQLRNEAMEKGVKEGTAEFNDMMRAINDEVRDVWLPKLAVGQVEPVVGAVRKWASHNEAVVAKYNKEIYGETRDAAKDLVGLRFHTDDVYTQKDFKKAQEALGQVQHKRASSETRAVNEGLSADQSYAVYAEKEASKFLDDLDKRAMEFIAKYKEAPILQGENFVASVAKRAEPVLHGFDAMTNFAKMNMLYFSASWLKNNFFDNLGKAWIETGLGGVVDTAKAMTGLQKGTARDVYELYKGNVSRAYEYEHFKDALNLGVLDNPMYKSLTDEVTRDFLFTPDQIKKAATDDNKLKGYLRRGRDLWMDKNPVIKVVGRVGSFMEGQARLMTYVNTLEQLRKTKAFKGVEDAALKRMAAKVTRQTFFDYGDVTALEAAVFKRMIPFYSFYSKNVPYWVKATFDPERAGRVLALEKVRHNVGRDPTKSERDGMSPYLAENAPRVLGKDKQGNEQYMVVPSFSLHDAAKMLNPKEVPNQFVEKGNPIVKAGIELATGKDLFGGGNLYPSQEPNGRKYLYSRGFKWYAVKKGLEYLGYDADSAIQKIASTSGVELDERGNPYTTKGWNVILDKLGSTFLPHGFVDQLAGAIGKGAVGKQTIDEAILHLVTPAQKVKVSPAQASMVRARKAASREAE